MLDHVSARILPMRGVEACTAFCRDQVGFHLDGGDERKAHLTIGNEGRQALALLSMASAGELITPERVHVDAPSVHRTCFAIFVDDVDQEHSELVSKGVALVRSLTTRSDGWRDAFFEDPEGNLWESSQRPQG